MFLPPNGSKRGVCQSSDLPPPHFSLAEFGSIPGQRVTQWTPSAFEELGQQAIKSFMVI